MKLQPSHSKRSDEAASTRIAKDDIQSNDMMSQLPEPTFGQKLADKLAAKVGSWGFLIGQTTVLTAWVGCNLTPGLPHWDESPFILLNLVFSFASAYTAPVVLMSQNRQSEEDRQHAMQNYQINLQTAQNLELMHEKMDTLYSQKLAELSELMQQAAQAQSAQTHFVQSAHTKATQPLLPEDSFNYVGFLPHTMTQSQQFYGTPKAEVCVSSKSGPAAEAADFSMRHADSQ